MNTSQNINDIERQNMNDVSRQNMYGETRLRVKNKKNYISL